MSKSEISDYLSEIGRHPVLCKEAQLRHCMRIHAWVNHASGRENAPRNVQQAGRRSMEVMTRTNIRLVVAIAKRYQGRGMDLADLIQEGTLGLIRGLELYDPSRGYQVSTYVYWWIRQSVTRALHVQARSIRLPINTHETLNKINKYQQNTLTKEGRDATLPEIAEHMNISKDRIREMLDQKEITRCVSLDVSVLDSDQSLQQVIADPSQEESYAALDQSINVQMAQDAIDDVLNPNESAVIKGLFMEDKTMRLLAEELNCSRARIGQVRDNAFNKLRLYFKRRGLL